MKKRLYLIRHSYAEDPGSISDIERALTLQGQSTVRSLGRHLLKEKFKPDIIYCSTAQRTRETAINLVEELDMSEKVITYKEIIYNAAVREMLSLVNEIENASKEVAIIGHNPTVTYFAEYITGAGIGNMEPSSIVTISFDAIKWNEISQGSGTFISYFHPSQLIDT